MVCYSTDVHHFPCLLTQPIQIQSFHDTAHNSRRLSIHRVKHRTQSRDGDDWDETSSTSTRLTGSFSHKSTALPQLSGDRTHPQTYLSGERTHPQTHFSGERTHPQTHFSGERTHPQHVPSFSRVCVYMSLVDPCLIGSGCCGLPLVMSIFSFYCMFSVRVC